MMAFASIPICLRRVAGLQKSAFPTAGVAMSWRATRSARLKRPPVDKETNRAGDQYSASAPPEAKTVPWIPRECNPVRMPETRASVPRLWFDCCESRIPTLISSPSQVSRWIGLFLGHDHEHTRDRRETRQASLHDAL